MVNILWKQLPVFSVIIARIIVIIHFYHFRGICAACSSPVGHATVTEGIIYCRRLPYGKQLTTSCSRSASINGILLNETRSVFRITSLADYGTYHCMEGDEVVTYFVLPQSCDVCADKYVTVDVQLYNLTHINVSCAIHVGLSFCCSVHYKYIYKNNTNSRNVNEGLHRKPTNLTTYRCYCSFKCRDANFKREFNVAIASNDTIFNFTNTIFTTSAVSVAPTTTTDTITATSQVNAARTTSTAITTSTTATTTEVSIASILSATISPTCVCNDVDFDSQQHRGSIIVEIIGSFMAGVFIATVIILLTGAVCIRKLYARRTSNDQTVQIKTGGGTPSTPGLKLEFGKNKTVVRYHPAPVLPPTDQPEANNNTSCSEELEETINTSSSNIDITSRTVASDNNTETLVEVEPTPLLISSNSSCTMMAQTATPEQCTQSRNVVYHGSQQNSYHDPQQNQRKRFVSHDSSTSLH